MIAVDKEKFILLVSNCFQNYSREVSDELIDDWFEELRGFSFYHLRKAFSKYCRKEDRYSPNLAKIIKLCKLEASQRLAKERDEKLKQCYVDHCKSKELQPCSFNPAVSICRNHEDDLILKTNPHSFQAEIVRRSQQFEEEAKLLGRTNQEHFSKTNAKVFEMLTKRRKQIENEEVGKKAVKALRDFYFADLPPDIRQSGVEAMRRVIEEAKIKKSTDMAVG